MIESPYTAAGCGGSARVDSRALPPPTYVRYLPQGEIIEAALSLVAPHPSARRASTAQREGIRYQRKIERWAVGGKFDGSITFSPWYYFVDGSGRRHFCQPDILFDDGAAMVVAEVKLSWTADAWWQLRRLYLPVLAKIYPRRVLIPLCICKSFDPAVAAPEEVNLIPDLLECKPDLFNVLMVAG